MSYLRIYQAPQRRASLAAERRASFTQRRASLSAGVPGASGGPRPQTAPVGGAAGGAAAAGGVAAAGGAARPRKKGLGALGGASAPSAEAEARPKGPPRLVRKDTEFEVPVTALALAPTPTLTR